MECVQNELIGDFNGDGAVNVLDNIAFNVAWNAFATSGEYNSQFDLWPSAPDSAINIYDKLEFHKHWQP